jgi:hypothetical protein
MNTPLIGVSGRGKSGKDSIADYLLKNGWSKKVSLAGVLKSFCSKFFSVPIEKFYDQSLKEVPFEKPIILDMAIKNKLSMAVLNRHYPKSNASVYTVSTPRELLQIVGSDILRSVDKDCWLTLLKSSVKTLDRLIIPDIRFPNEAEFILSNGGILIRARRASKFTLNSNHISETALDDWADWSYIVDSEDKDLDYLYSLVDEVIKDLRGSLCQLL